MLSAYISIHSFIRGFIPQAEGWPGHLGTDTAQSVVTMITKGARYGREAWALQGERGLCIPTYGAVCHEHVAYLC